MSGRNRRSGSLGLRVRKQWSSRRIQSGRRQQSIVCSRNSLVFRVTGAVNPQENWKGCSQGGSGARILWWLKPLGGLWLFFWAKWGVTIREWPNGVYRQKDPSQLIVLRLCSRYTLGDTEAITTIQTGGWIWAFPTPPIHCDAMNESLGLKIPYVVPAYYYCFFMTSMLKTF